MPRYRAMMKHLRLSRAVEPAGESLNLLNAFKAGLMRA